MTGIAIFGEVMLELSGADREAMRLGHGGDTLNTAVYLARLGEQVTYITALGQDPYSDGMIKAFDEEGVDTSFILRHPSRLPGLYAIQTDPGGERRFHYWRGQSAAREFFNLPGGEQALAFAATADLLYFSGISLSILGGDDQRWLLQLARDVSARGGKVAFDPNFRPAGWPAPAMARALFQALAQSLDWVLTTDTDEALLFGESEPAKCIARWKDWGAGEVVVKAGRDGAWLEGGVNVPAAKPSRIVDTTGAGDSFNAAWLHARLAGKAPEAAAEAGNRLAANVIGHSGAIMPRTGA